MSTAIYVIVALVASSVVFYAILGRPKYLDNNHREGET